MFFLLSCATTCTEKDLTQYFPKSKDSEFLYRGVNEFYPPDVLEGLRKNNWICSPANSFLSTSER